jgi:hypothetical protein
MFLIMKNFLQNKRPQMTFAFIVLVYFISQVARIQF